MIVITKLSCVRGLRFGSCGASLTSDGRVSGLQDSDSHSGAVLARGPRGRVVVGWRCEQPCDVTVDQFRDVLRL